MYAFSIEGNRSAFTVVQFTGYEELAKPYQFEIEVTSPSHDLSMSTTVGKNALLTIRQGNKTVHRHGLIEQAAVGAKSQGLTTYRFVLSPAIVQLDLQTQNRIFQDATVIGVLNQILDTLSISNVEFQLQNSYTLREYTVQFAETSLDFMHRLMEEEGIYYFFKHTASGHRLVFADHKDGYADMNGKQSIAYAATGGSLKNGAITDFEFDVGLTTNSVSLRDYNFQTPNLNLQVSKSQPATKVYQYNGYPGGYQSITEGNKIARSMLDALQAEKALGKGASHDTRINPGYTFKLTRHTSKRLNKKYVVLGVTHEGSVDDSGKAHYQNRFYCMRANERFVPIYGLAHRRVYGPQTATVAGPANEEIFVDEYGRVKVQFHWDQEGNGNSSAWIRVSQMMAGDGWGSLFIPRIGHEVIVDFLDGNPDRPIITGQVYNGNNQPPYPLPAGKTRSGIKTRSSKNGGSRSSELCFEDKKGSEEVLLKSAKDLMTQAANNMNIAVGNNLHYNVSQNYTFVVSNTANSSIGGNQTDNTGSNRTSIIGNNHKLNIGKNKTVEVGAHYQETTQKTRTIKAGKINIEASDGFSVKVGKAAISLSKNGTITLKSDGNINIKSAKKISIKAAKISQDDY